MTQNPIFQLPFGLKVRQLVDLDEVGMFGVEDTIFRLDDEVEEGVNGAENELEALKKKEMNFFSLQVHQSDIYAIIKG